MKETPKKIVVSPEHMNVRGYYVEMGSATILKSGLTLVLGYELLPA